MKKKTLVILALVMAALAIYGAYASISGTIENGWAAAGLFAALALLFAWRASRKTSKAGQQPAQAAAPQSTAKQPETKKQEKPQPQTNPQQPTAKEQAPQQKPEYFTVYSGRLNGVTFQGRQRTLERLKKKQDEEFEDIRFELEAGKYEGEPCVSVMAGLWEDESLKQIGFIPAKSVDKVLPYAGQAIVTGEIYGGPEDEFDENPKSYGCSVEVSVKIEK